MYDDIIQKQFYEVDDVVYLMSGKVNVGFWLYNDYFKGLIIGERKVIGDFSILDCKVSEFEYRVESHRLSALTITYVDFIKVIDHPFWKKFTPIWQMTYLETIQKKVCIERKRILR